VKKYFTGQAEKFKNFIKLIFKIFLLNYFYFLPAPSYIKPKNFRVAGSYKFLKSSRVGDLSSFFIFDRSRLRN